MCERLDSDFVARVRAALADSRVGVVARLFRLQIPVARDLAAEELGEAAIEALIDAGFVEADARELRPVVSLSTFGNVLIASDLLATVDQGDHVLGIGPASRTLARLTIRSPVTAALDLGTGSGVQAVLAAAHAERVVGVDVNERALAFAERNAALNGVDNVEWRLGSWLEPVAGERFGLVVSNPPYVVSPDKDLAFRDSGEEGDTLVRRLLGEITEALDEGGYAQVACDWIPRSDGDWRSPLEESIRGRGCDAALLKYGETEGGAYAAAWNRHLAASDRRAFAAAVERWTSHYRQAEIESIAFGMVVLRRRTNGHNWIRALEVPGRATDDAGEHVLRLFEGWDWARAANDELVLDTAFAPARGARLVERRDVDDGFELGAVTFEVHPNAGFAARIDPVVARTVRRFDGRRSLREVLEEKPCEARDLMIAEIKRLFGLGLLTVSRKGRKIERS